MVQIGFNSDGGDYKESLQFNLGHESRHEGTISDVSDVIEMDDYQGDGKVEKIIITLRSTIDEDLDVDEDTQDDMVDYIEERNEELDEEKEPYSTEYVELSFFPKAVVTRGAGNQYSNSKLYDTLYKLDLVEPEDDTEFVFLDREGNEVNPFEDVEDENDEEEMNAAFVQYLRDNLTGMKVKYELKNANRDNPDKDEYSTVSKFVELVEDKEAE